MPDQLQEGRINQPPFVMSLLVPGVGEENLYPIQTFMGNTLLQHELPILAIDADILQGRGGGLHEQVSQTRTMHFNANEVSLWVCLGLSDERVAHAETNLISKGMVIAKNCGGVNQTCAGLQAKAVPLLCQGARLTSGESPLPEYKGTDTSTACQLWCPLFVKKKCYGEKFYEAFCLLERMFAGVFCLLADSG